jgi:hypothetical protein
MPAPASPTSTSTVSISISVFRESARPLARRRRRGRGSHGAGRHRGEQARGAPRPNPDSPVVARLRRARRLPDIGPIGRRILRHQIAQALERWGLSRIGELARLSEGDVVARFGEAGRLLHQVARGIDPRPLVPRVVPPLFSEGMELEWPIVAVEPFLFVARTALERLTMRLASHALACARLTLALTLDPGGADSRTVDLPAPTRDVKTLLTLVRLDLEARRPGAPVSGFRFIAHPDRPRSAQLSLFGPPAISPERLATCIARLARVSAPAARTAGDRRRPSSRAVRARPVRAAASARAAGPTAARPGTPRRARAAPGRSAGRGCRRGLPGANRGGCSITVLSRGELEGKLPLDSNVQPAGFAKRIRALYLRGRAKRP